VYIYLKRDINEQELDKNMVISILETTTEDGTIKGIKNV
jgi:hypothetical protein